MGAGESPAQEFSPFPALHDGSCALNAATMSSSATLLASARCGVAFRISVGTLRECGCRCSWSEIVGGDGIELGGCFDAFRTVGDRDVAEAALRGAGYAVGRLRCRDAADEGGQVLDAALVDAALGHALCAAGVDDLASDAGVSKFGQCPRQGVLETAACPSTPVPLPTVGP